MEKVAHGLKTTRQATDPLAPMHRLKDIPLLTEVYLGGVRYMVQDEIGHGSHGIVYSAYESKTGRRAAIKIANTDKACSNETLLSEGRMSVSISRGRHGIVRAVQRDIAQVNDHTGVVRVIGRGIEQGRHFLVMELLSGRSLDEIITSVELSRERRIRVISGIFHGLRTLQEAGVVHRDIKPNNLILDGDTVTITDLGIATNIGTRERGISGTLRYCAPEQRDGHIASSKQDVYAAAVTAYEIATGELPFGLDRLNVDQPIQRAYLDSWILKERGDLEEVGRKLEGFGVVGQVISQALNPDEYLRITVMNAIDKIDRWIRSNLQQKRDQ